MEPLEHLHLMARAKIPAFVLFHDPSILPEVICASIVRCFDDRVTVVRLRSDHVTADEGAFIRDTLFDGRVLLVIVAPQARKLPADMLKAWEFFREDPHHSSTSAGRFIHFDSEHARLKLGMLGLVLPKNYEGGTLQSNMTVRIRSADELGASRSPLEEVRTVGRAAVSVSMKTLCFLHHRDPAGASPHDSFKEIIEGRRPLTWSDLQRVLQQQPDYHMFSILEGFAAEGRVSTEQLDLAAETIAYLSGECSEDERIGWRGLAPSIYHALWIYRFLERAGCVFRGQCDSRWRQDTTLLRAEPDGTPAMLASVVERLHRTQAFLDALAAREQEIVGRPLDEYERLAIAQHYGMPTPLLDYTRSLAIAAFFATGAGDPSSLQPGDVGVIYYISPRDLVAGNESDDKAHALDLARAAGIRVGRLTTIEPALPDRENRIARQKGLFVDGFDSRDLQRLSLGVLYFRQQPGEAFEDFALGITRARLLTPDAKLQQLADSIASRPPKLSARLTATRLPGDDVFGALGMRLPANLHKAQKFIDQLAVQAERVEPGLWLALKSILERHLAVARIAARTADISAPNQLVARDVAGISHMLDDVNNAFHELAAVADLSPDALEYPLNSHRPLPRLDDAPVNEPVKLPSSTRKAQVVLAVAFFIVGLEYLRTVRGEVAEQYFQKADEELFVAMERKTERDDTT